MNRKKLWKLSIVLFAFAMLSSSSSNAAEVVSGDVLKNTGMGGANLNKVTGAKVDTDLTNATITNTVKNSVLEWKSLNTGRNQSLNYIFPESIGSGQTSLNKVLGVGMSQFAGKLTTEGAGHVIISNPNGMIMYNGAMVNANELTLTTKSVLLDELGNMTIRDNGLKNPIVIGKENGTAGATVIRVAKNLNIVAPIINVNGADIAVVDKNDNLLGGNIRLITSDGVNFYVDTNSFKANQGTLHGAKNITVNNAKIAVKNSETGKIYLTSKGHLDITNSKISNAKAEVLGYVNIKNGTDIENSSLYGTKGVNVENSKIVGSSLATESNIKILNNTTVDSTRFYAQKGNADITNAVVKNGSVIKAGVFNADNSKIENSTVETSYIANVINNSTLTNSKINAGHNVKISNAKTSKSDVQSKQKIYVDTNSVIDSTRLFANSEIFVSNAKIENDSMISTDKDLIITNAILEGNGNLHLYSGNLTRLIDTTARGLYFTGNSVAFYSSRISNSDLDIKNALTITNNSELSNVFGVSHGELNINGNSRVANNSTLASTKGISLGDATIANSNIISEKSVYAQKTTFDNANISSTNGDVYLADLTVMNNSKLSAKNILEIDSSNLMNATVDADVVKIITSRINNSDVKADSDILFYNVNNNNSKVLSYGTLELHASEIFNSDVSSVGEMNLFGTNTLENSKLFTNGKLVANGLFANNSFVGAEDTAYIEKSKFENSKVYAKNYLTLKTNNVINNSNLSSIDIEIGNSEVRNTKLDAKRHVSFYRNSIAENIYTDYLQSISVTTDSKIRNSNLRVGYLLLDNVISESVNADAKYDLKYYNTTFLGSVVNAYANGNIYVETENVISGNYNAKGKFQAKSSNWKKRLTLDNANVTAGDSIKLMSSPVVSNSKLSTNGTLTSQKSAISNSEVLAKTLYGQDSIIKDSTINATNDIIVSNSNITNSSLIATKDLKLENTNLNKVSANGRYAFLNNAVLENNTNLTADRLSTQGTNDYQTGNIVYKAGMTVENLTIKDSTMKVKDDVYLKNALLDNAIIETTIGKELHID